jgi:molecular chaperone DnaK (HSP70)
MLRPAIQANVLADEIKDLLFLNVTALSLGVVETLGGVFAPRNSLDFISLLFSPPPR